MKKKIMSLVLALVMCVGLAVPAFAAPADSLDANTIGSIESPRYAVNKVPYSIYIGNLTYADMVFTISDRGGNYAFESLDSLSFSAVSTSGTYWKLDSYDYHFSGTECKVIVSRSEMYAGNPTGYSDSMTITVALESVAASSRESGPAIVSSGTVSSVVEETWAVRMSAEEFMRQVAEGGIESVERVPVHCAD